jgi:uncharacterized protein
VLEDPQQAPQIEPVCPLQAARTFGPKDDPADVAADGFAAMMSGDDHVVAGSRKNTVQAAAAKVMPERVKAAVHARQTEPT